MDIRSAKVVCFSPTGTSRMVAEAVARGAGCGEVEVVDITLPQGRSRRLETAADELLVVAVPVYVGRVPELPVDWFESVRAAGTPAVCIVVYGNREFDDALLELTDLVEERGGIPVAAAAFIGEHSFSTAATPIAVARPDADDLRRAEAFGGEVRDRLRAVASAGDAAVAGIPGTRPYRDRLPFPPPGAIAVGDGCVDCGACAGSCPVGAIDPEDSRRPGEACILCCACVRTCPEGARTLEEPTMRAIAAQLSRECSARKAPVCFV